MAAPSKIYASISCCVVCTPGDSIVDALQWAKQNVLCPSGANWVIDHDPSIQIEVCGIHPGNRHFTFTAACL